VGFHTGHRKVETQEAKICCRVSLLANTNCQHHHKDTTPHQRCILYVWFRTSPCNLRYRSSSTPSHLADVTQSPKYLVSSVVLGQLLLQQISKFLCSTRTQSRVCTLASYIAVLQKEQSLNLLTILCLSLRVGRRFLTIRGWQMTHIQFCNWLPLVLTALRRWVKSLFKLICLDLVTLLFSLWTRQKHSLAQKQPLNCRNEDQAKKRRPPLTEDCHSSQDRLLFGALLSNLSISEQQFCDNSAREPTKILNFLAVSLIGSQDCCYSNQPDIARILGQQWSTVESIQFFHKC